MSDVLREELTRVLEAGPDLRLALLFGSRARGEARRGSDVDVAILPAAHDMSLAEENRLGAALERAARAPVDLVRIDRAPAALRWRIARDGIVLLSNPSAAASRFLARAGIAHDETRELHLDAMRRFRARLAGTPPERVR